MHVHQEGESHVVKESFAGFKEQHREMTGEAVASTILQKLDELGLNCENLHGQGYDGSGFMAVKCPRLFEHGKRQDKLEEVIESELPEDLSPNCDLQDLGPLLASRILDPLTVTSRILVP
ncbi:hypothetical protein EMCRGX_G018462 [Ephydatia muelleri]